MEEMTQEELEEILMNVRLLLANIENFKYISTNAEYLEKKVVAEALAHAINNIEPVLKSTQMAVELQILLQNPNAGA